MSGPVECQGAPRDLGRDQGRAARDALRALAGEQGFVGRWRDHLQLGDPGTGRWLRDLRRYFPHQHEWLEGAARASGLPTRALARVAVAALDAERDALLVGIEGDEGAALWRSAARDSGLRRVHPEGRFRSIELASPALAAPWIGVNESGLAVAVTGGRRSARCTAHAALLARDCLERFESVESSLAWCLGRPASPGANILLADDSGELAGVELLPAGREVRRAESGVLVLGSGAADLLKSIADQGGRRARIAALLASEPCGAREAASHVDVASRSLQASSHSSQSETASSGSSVTRQ